MTGFPANNYAAFNRMATRLRLRGYRIINPAEIAPHTPDRPRDYFIREGLKLLLDNAEAVALLDGWKESPGARLEVATALETGLPIFRADDLLSDAAHPIAVRVRMEVAA